MKAVSADVKGIFELNPNVESVWVDKDDNEVFYTAKEYAPNGGENFTEVTRLQATGAETAPKKTAVDASLTAESPAPSSDEAGRDDLLGPETGALEEFTEDHQVEEIDLAAAAGAAPAAPKTNHKK